MATAIDAAALLVYRAAWTRDARRGARHARGRDGEAVRHRVGAAGHRRGRAAPRRHAASCAASRSSGSTARSARFASTRERARSRSSSSRGRYSMTDESRRDPAHVDQFVRQRLPPGRPLAPHGLVRRAGAGVSGSPELRVGAARPVDRGGRRRSDRVPSRGRRVDLSPAVRDGQPHRARARGRFRPGSGQSRAAAMRPNQPMLAACWFGCSRPAASRCRRCRCCACAS